MLPRGRRGRNEADLRKEASSRRVKLGAWTKLGRPKKKRKGLGEAYGRRVLFATVVFKSKKGQHPS